MKLRQNLLDEPVADGERVFLEVFLAEVVGKTAAGLVAGRVRGLERDLRGRSLLVTQSEKSDVDVLVFKIAAGPRIKLLAHPHSGGRTGLRQAVHRQTATPLIDIILLVQVLDDRRLGVDDDVYLMLGDVAVPPVAPGSVGDRNPQKGLALRKSQGGGIDFDRLRRAVSSFQPQKTGGGKSRFGQHNLLAVFAELDPQSTQAAVRVLQLESQLGGFADKNR